MSLDILSKDILHKAEEHKKNLDIKFQEESSKLEEESKELILKFKNKLKNKSEIELKLNKDKIIGSSKRDAKKLILETKTNLMEESFNLAYNKILNLKTDEKNKILSSLIKQAKQLIEFDLIECNKKDLKFIKESLLKNNQIKIKAKENIEGLIFYSKNETEKLDFTLKTILIEFFENEEDKIQNKLFNI